MRRTLLVVDMQNAYFEDPVLHLWQARATDDCDEPIDAACGLTNQC